MANMHLVTGYAGQEHVTAADQGIFNAAVFGKFQAVLGKGNKLSASVLTNNSVRVLDGDIFMYGRHIRLNEGTYVDLTIENGQQGYKRNDLIVARYTKDASTAIEEVNLAVIKGTAVAGEPVDPEYTEGNIYDGGAVLHEMPLYRVPLDGLNVGSLVCLFSTFEDNFRDHTNSLVRHITQTERTKWNGMIPATQKGQANGVATLGADGKLPNSQLPDLEGYTKEETLKAATKTLFGLGASAVPDDVFAFLGKYNLHWWRRRTLTTNINLAAVTEDNVIRRGSSTTDVMEVQYSDSIEILEDGSFSLVNPSIVTGSYTDYSNFNVLKGKYFFGSSGDNTYYMAEDAPDCSRVTDSSTPKYCVTGDIASLFTTISAGEWEYVYSGDRNAYPDGGELNDQQYQYMGIPYENFSKIPNQAPEFIREVTTETVAKTVELDLSDINWADWAYILVKTKGICTAGGQSSQGTFYHHSTTYDLGKCRFVDEGTDNDRGWSRLYLLCDHQPAQCILTCSMAASITFESSVKTFSAMTNLNLTRDIYNIAAGTKFQIWGVR